MNTPRTDKTPATKTRPAAARAAGFKTGINALRLSRAEPLAMVQLEREGVTALREFEPDTGRG